MKLTTDNDKMEMIDIAINPINELINSFFKNLDSKKTILLNDYDIGKNILNINGSWCSGKSTIISNLETYYTQKYENDNITFQIFNLWEYETLAEPFYYLVKDLINKIFLNISNDSESKEEVSKKNKKISIWFNF